jgi:MoaA/NifB/PqqE/SkfB family radical SAM enzyme
MKTIVDDLASFHPNITLFGGEPLLYRGCVELIGYIKRRKMHCLIITNGSLLEEHAEGIVGNGLDELNVSLDGGSSLHDEIRGMKGLFDRIMKGLKKVRRIEAQAKRRRPLVNLQCTITKYNYERLEELLDVAREAGADSLTFHNLIFLDRKTLEAQREFDRNLGCSSADWEGFCFQPGIDPEVLYDKMAAIRSGRYRFSVDFYPNFSRSELMRYYTDAEYASRAADGRCVSPWMASYIFPDGEVRPCLNSDYSYGNAVSGRFTTLWNGEKAVKFRSFLKEKRAFPACCRCTELYRY